jgi:hypothetical protein
VKYLNIAASINEDAAFLRASHEQMGIWLCLQCYCHRQMNGGQIPLCQDWTDAMWGRIGLTSEQVAAESPLWHFTALGWLVVHGYDGGAEVAYQRKQKLGKYYAEIRWKKANERKIIHISGDDGKSSETQK